MTCVAYPSLCGLDRHLEARFAIQSAGVLLLGGVLYRALRLCWQALNHSARRARTIQVRMEDATSFMEWQSLASELDAIRDHSKQGGRTRDGKNDLYDEQLLAAKVAELEKLRAVGNIEDLMFAIRSDLYRDFGNISNRCATSSQGPCATERNRRETSELSGDVKLS